MISAETSQLRNRLRQPWPLETVEFAPSIVLYEEQRLLREKGIRHSSVKCLNMGYQRSETRQSQPLFDSSQEHVARLDISWWFTLNSRDHSVSVALLHTTAAPHAADHLHNRRCHRQKPLIGSIHHHSGSSNSKFRSY